MSKAGAKRAVRNVDDMLFLFTGKRLRDVVARGMNLFGDQLGKKAAGAFVGEEPEGSPYHILGVNRDAPDFLVKAAYRANMKKYHPDGQSPNEEMTKKINDAYDRICLERDMSK